MSLNLAIIKAASFIYKSSGFTNITNIVAFVKTVVTECKFAFVCVFILKFIYTCENHVTNVQFANPFRFTNLF